MAKKKTETVEKTTWSLVIAFVAEKGKLLAGIVTSVIVIGGAITWVLSYFAMTTDLEASEQRQYTQNQEQTERHVNFAQKIFTDQRKEVKELISIQKERITQTRQSNNGIVPEYMIIDLSDLQAELDEIEFELKQLMEIVKKGVPNY